MKVLYMFNLHRLFTWVFVSQPAEIVQRQCISPKKPLERCCKIFVLSLNKILSVGLYLGFAVRKNLFKVDGEIVDESYFLISLFCPLSMCFPTGVILKILEIIFILSDRIITYFNIVYNFNFCI